MLLLDSVTAGAQLPGGYGWALLQALLALVAVSVLAWLVLRWGTRRMDIIKGPSRVRVLERTYLDAKHAVFLLQADERRLLVGTGDGAPRLIAELEPGSAPPQGAGGASFRQILSQAVARRGDGGVPTQTESIDSPREPA